MKTPEQGESWGILGGTFDPIHEGHLRLASDVQRLKNLDGILLIPSFYHPFKNEQTAASYDDRLAMTKLAVSLIDSFVLSTIEKDKKLSGYSIDTIKAVKNFYADVQFSFIIGADNIAQLPLWHKASEIIKEIKIIAGKRPPFDMLTIKNEFSDSVEYVESGEVDISSSEIKNLIRNKEFEKLKTILHQDVLQFIRERNLYQ